jgi:hypothetical protein
MKIIKNDFVSFNDNNDSVTTEKTVYQNILQDFDILPEDFNYVDLPVADIINKSGFNLNHTQEIILKIENQYPNIIKRYVCQHIYVNHLNFYNNKVYTPHTLINDNLIVIPHCNPCIQENSFIPFNQRIYNCSFIGTLATHPTRFELTKLNNNKDIIVRETGGWHFAKTENDQKKYADKYKEILCNTKFSLCPPGTGVSTIRLYESMAAGCIPILFNNVKVPKIVEKYVIRLYNIKDVLDINFSSEKYIEQAHELKTIYWKHLSNNNFYKLLYD